MIRRIRQFLRRCVQHLKSPESVPPILLGLVVLVVLAWSGWFRALRDATLGSAIVMVLLLGLLIFAALAIWPSVAHLFSHLLYGDPYWIKPREFDIDDDPSKTEALTRRLAPIEVDADATLWRDQESGQYWISRRFELASGEMVRFKPLASRETGAGWPTTTGRTGAENPPVFL